MKFRFGNRVKQYDEFEKAYVYGYVVEVCEDSVFIQWDDIYDSCEHFQEEYSSIKITHRDDGI